MTKLRPWHWCAVAIVSLLVLLALWFALAYGGLPRLWSHHEHKRIGRHDEIVSYSAQDIPADPINLRIVGDAPAIARAFAAAGWTAADPITVGSALRIASSVILHRPYPGAPVSSLYVRDRAQDLAFQKDEGKSADRRHHVRFWKVGPNDWLGAASFDRGVGLSLFTLQITHHIGREVDPERDTVGGILAASGGRFAGVQPSRVPPGQWHRNGGGDRYRTDGRIRIYAMGGRSR